MNYAIKIRATRACHAMSRSKKYQNYRRQAGVTLIELMVGIAIGLMVVAVALGALMVSRGVSGTVSDASNIQQQAAYAMRVIGAQIRQAGSLYINMTYQTNNADPYLAQVAIETSAPASGTYNAFEPSTDTIKGASDSMTIGYRRYKETVTNPANPGQEKAVSASSAPQAGPA